jgi:ribosomal protein S18 acetylase RimI-like enzyme
MELELREVDDAVRAELVREVRVADHQLDFVSDVEDSLAEAAEAPEANPWYRGVYDDGVPVGFVMIAWDVDPAEGLIGPWFLWKLAIDRDHQGRGYGRAVIDALVEIIRAEGGTELYTSYTEGEGGPAPFYARLGFVATGKEHDGEVLVVKQL